MPRTLFDEEGNSIEVPTEDELKALQGAQTELEGARTKLADMEKTLGSNDPSIRGMRQRIKDLEKLTKQAPAAEEPESKPEPKGLTDEDVARIADERFVNRYRDHALTRFGDKADAVKSIFDKLSAGEQLTEAKVDEYLGIAARAAGVNQGATQEQRALAFRGGSAPQFQVDNKGQDFADTEAGKGLASAMGITLEAPKK